MERKWIKLPNVMTQSLTAKHNRLVAQRDQNMGLALTHFVLYNMGLTPPSLVAHRITRKQRKEKKNEKHRRYKN